METRSRPPVIVIGMHRSGTGMITQMLEGVGLFMGKKKQWNHEALFFLQMNDWLLRQCGASWDHPAPVRHLLENREVRELAVDYIRHSLSSPRIISFMGLARYLKYRNPTGMNVPWGWKDPRNTLTLPVWLDVFPAAKVIHIYRHGVDVASSLRVRQLETLKEGRDIYERRKPLYKFKAKGQGFTDTLRCATLEGGFTLWEEYLLTARDHVKDLKDQALEIDFKDFLSEPEEGLMEFARFCGLNVTEEKVLKVAGEVNRERAEVYKRDPELQRFANQVATRLEALGFSSDVAEVKKDSATGSGT